MNDMVKEVFVAIRANTSATVAEAEAATRAAIRAVLEHFSEPSNVTDGMADALLIVWEEEAACDEHMPAARVAIADAMRAARDEVSRG